VSNAIKTQATKRSRQRKRSFDLPDDLQSPPHQDHNDLIREFRLWLRARYGEVAVRVFDHRLDGGDTGDLLGEPGLETSYRLKKVVASIKEAAREYFQRDPEIFQIVQNAFEREKATLSRRFSRVAAG